MALFDFLEPRKKETKKDSNDLKDIKDVKDPNESQAATDEKESLVKTEVKADVKEKEKNEKQETEKGSLAPVVLNAQGKKENLVEYKKDEKAKDSKKEVAIHISQPLIISFKADKKTIRNDITFTGKFGEKFDTTKIPVIKGYKLKDKLPDITFTEKTQHVVLNYIQKKVKVTLVPVSEDLKEIPNAQHKDIRVNAGENVDPKNFPIVSGYYVYKQRSYTAPAQDGKLNIVYGASKQAIHIVYETESGEILGEIIKHGKTGQKYEINPKERTFYGYELGNLPQNATGIFKENTPDVIIKFIPIKTKLQVTFLDESGNEIHKPLSFEDGHYKGAYNITLPKIDGYELTSNPKKLSGVYSHAEEKVVLRFKKAEVKFKINLWFDNNHSKSAGKAIEVSGVVNSEYNQTVPVIAGYKASQTELSGTFTTNSKDIDIVYTPIDCKIKLFIEDEAGRVIETVKPIIKKGKWGDKYKIELPDIAGYKKTKNEITGTFTDVEKQIIVRYIPNSVNIVVRYIDSLTKKTIPEFKEEKYTAVVGSSYEIDPEIIEGYKLKELPENASGIVPSKDVIVTFKYEPYKSQVILHFYDTTYNTLKKNEVIEGYFGNSINYKPEEIQGYQFKSSSVPLDSSFGASHVDIDLLYQPEYVSFELVPVDQFDKDLGKKYHQVVKGLVGQSFSAQLPSISGYYAENTAVNGHIKADYDKKQFKIKYLPLTATVNIRTIISGGSLNGQTPFEDTVIHGYIGEKYEYTVPKLLGHHNDKKVISGIFRDVVKDIELVYQVDSEQYLIHFVDSNDALVGGMQEATGNFGDTIEVYKALPKGFILPPGMEFTKIVLNGSHVYKVPVVPKPVTVNLIAQTEDGQPLNGVQRQVLGKYHQKQVLDVPRITGYTPINGSQISLNFELGERTVPIIYRPEERTLTVRYLSTQGETLLSPDVIKGHYQEEYQVEAKPIPGYFVVDTPLKRGTFDHDNLDTAFIYRAGSDEFSRAVADLENVVNKPAGDAPSDHVNPQHEKVNRAAKEPKNLIDTLMLNNED